MTDKQHQYEKIQNLNAITRVLHRVRYANLEKLAVRVSNEIPRTIKIIDIGCGPAKSFQVLSDLGIDFQYNMNQTDISISYLNGKDRFHNNPIQMIGTNLLYLYNANNRGWLLYHNREY